MIHPHFSLVTTDRTSVEVRNKGVGVEGRGKKKTAKQVYFIYLSDAR
jgi:hypothetical protein